MLKDRPRHEAYYNAIMSNKTLFKNKTVLDVGAGTGILSLFCAKAGAKLVYAVEASNLAKVAIEIVEENNLKTIVKVFQTKIEDFQLPSNSGKIDIIVSEWMGFYLLHEGMLDSILYARDTFLKDDGLMFPQYATLYVAPCQVPSLFDYWNNIDTIKMTKFGEKLRLKKSNKPEIMVINKDDLLHEGITMSWLDLKEITLDDLAEISIKEVIAIEKAGKHQGFCIWFTCEFPQKTDQENSSASGVILSTGPCDPPTHWKQCVILLPDFACEEVTQSEPVAFQIKMKRNPDDMRKYNLEVELLDPKDVEHPFPCNCHMTKCILTKAHLENYNANDESKNNVEMETS